MDLGPWPAAALAPWLAVALLGMYHGVNPAMGWLFAVALGLQQHSRQAVLRALLPIAVGHEASLAAVALLVAGLGLVAAPDTLRAAAAVALVLFGAYKLLRPRSHPRWAGMRVGTRDLALWSFLMSTAHGAGLMLIPTLLGLAAAGSVAHSHAADAGGAVHSHGPGGAVFEAGALSAASLAPNAAALLLHTLAMLVTMAIVALLVYEKLGLSVLRRAWINLDAIWAVAVIAAGLFTLFS
jgi:hypothetical protein